MITCPACGFTRNMEGADLCEKCESPLIELTKPRGGSEMARSIHKDRIRTLSPRPPLVVPPETKLSEVLKLMVDLKVGCVVIVEDLKAVGIFSERDALMRLNTDSSALSGRPVSEFMTPSPETLEMDDKIAFALHKMDLGGYRHVPVTNAGNVVGVISVRDILRYVTEHHLAEA